MNTMMNTNTTMQPTRNRKTNLQFPDNRLFCWIYIFIGLFLTPALFGQGATMINDNYPGNVWAYPGNITVAGDYVYFTNTDHTDGYQELFKTDGSEAGTQSIKDIHQGPYDRPEHLINFNGILIFFSGSNDQLWRSDGTEGGTYSITNISGGIDPDDDKLAVVGNYLFFEGPDYDLWKTDGTVNGEMQVSPIEMSPESFVSFNGQLIFAGDDEEGDQTMWISDGTEAGTKIIKDGIASSEMENVTVVNDLVIFEHSGVDYTYELWRTNGTATGTYKIKDLPGGADNFIAFNNAIYFKGDDGTTGDELWKTDGTTAGTELVKDIYEGMQYGNPASSRPDHFTIYNGELYFKANDGINDEELWKSDGTEAGTMMLKDIGTQYGSGPSEFVVFNGVLYFNAWSDGNSNELWKTDGTTTGTVLAQEFRPGTNSGGPGGFVHYKGDLIFRANSDDYGYELWIMKGIPETPAAEVGATVANLTDLLDDPELPAGASGDLANAIDDLNAAAANFEANDAQEAYKDLEDAMSALMDAVDAGADLSDQINAILELAEGIVSEDLTEAETFGGDPQVDGYIDDANDFLADAAEEEAEGNYNLMIRRLASARKELQRAIHLGSAIAQGMNAETDVNSAVADIQNVIATGGFSGAANADLADAVDELNDAIADFNNGDIRAGYDDLQDAVEQLQDAEADGADASAEIVAIVDLAKMLAEVKISEAQGYAGNPDVDSRVADAQADITDGDDELADDNPDKAVKEYRDAWEDARIALEHGRGLRKTGDEGSGAALPATFALEQNYPNPFNPNTTIRFALPAVSTVTLKVYNVAGQLVSTLLNKTMTAGYHQVNWNGRRNNGPLVSSGLYFYHISAGDFQQVKKMMLIK